MKLERKYTESETVSQEHVNTNRFKKIKTEIN